MLRTRFTMFGLSATLVLLAALATGAAEKDADGWIMLFDGKSLDGWKASEGVKWSVDGDGCIVTPPKKSHLFTVQEFENFEFQADVWTEPGSNAGIYFHTKYEDNWPSVGYECQVNQTHADPVKSGSLYNVVKVYESAAKDQEWYTTRITVKGKAITITINGRKLYEYVEPDGVSGTRKLSKGSFALQAHDPKSVVKFKNIKVKPL